MKKISNYQILNSSVENTGGNCLVTIYTVYDFSEKVVRTLIVDTHNYSYAAIDFISYDIAPDEAGIISSGDINPDTPIEVEPQLSLLLKECYLQHLLSMASSYKENYLLHVSNLPDYMLEELPPQLIEYFNEDDQYITIDIEGVHLLGSWIYKM